MSFISNIFKKLKTSKAIQKTEKKISNKPEQKISQLIPDLENIIAEYLDIDDYTNLIIYNPKLYCWEKYFNHQLPDIHDAINIYDNLDLVKYIIQKTPPREFDFRYEKTDFKSITIAEYIIHTFPFLHDYDYTNCVYRAIISNNPEVIKYLLLVETKSEKKSYHEFYTTRLNIMFRFHIFEMIRPLLELAKTYLIKGDYGCLLEDIIEKSLNLDILEIKKYIKRELRRLKNM